MLDVSVRKAANRQLIGEIRRVHADSEGRNGSQAACCAACGGTTDLAQSSGKVDAHHGIRGPPDAAVLSDHGQQPRFPVGTKSPRQTVLTNERTELTRLTFVTALDPVQSAHEAH
jgi:hypothetical protein